jgi:hypothetical protein
MKVCGFKLIEYEECSPRCCKIAFLQPPEIHPDLHRALIIAAGILRKANIKRIEAGLF